MIVRILGEGQFRVEDALLDELNTFDRAVESAIEQGDEEALTRSLTTLLDAVRAAGVEVEADLLLESDVILPYADADLHQVREWLDGTESPDGQGLIPG